MGYYVVSDGVSAKVYTSWANAKENLKGHQASTCRSFEFKAEMERFVEGLRFDSPPADTDQIAFCDGACFHGKAAFGGAYFGPTIPGMGRGS